MPDYLIIDAHIHTYPTPAIGRQAKVSPGDTDLAGTVEEYTPLLAAAGIRRAVMVNMFPSAEMRAAAYRRIPPDLDSAARAAAARAVEQTLHERLVRRNRWTCAVAAREPAYIPFVTVDEAMPAEAMCAEVEACAAAGARGLKLHPDLNRFYPEDRRLYPAYEAAQALGLPITFHSGRFFDPNQAFSNPERFRAVARDFPRLQIVLAHLGNGYWQEAVELAQAYPNVAFDCSEVLNERPSGDGLDDEEMTRLMRALGVERVLFGSDFPWFDPVRSVRRLERLPLTDDERRLIFGENAQRLLGIER